MSTQKRLRIFAGPNGSGKTKLFETLRSLQYFHTIYYVNADVLLSELEIGFSAINWPLSDIETNLPSFFTASNLRIKLTNPSLFHYLHINSTFIKFNDNISEEEKSYVSAIFADFLRIQLINTGVSFSMETVFSHPSKIDLLKHARESGYKVYLYFIATEDPVINTNRVASRVLLGGHNVPDEKINSRYYKSMNNLIDMLMNVDKAFIFDNSQSLHDKSYINFAEVKNGEIDIITDNVPNWFDTYVLKKIVQKNQKIKEIS